jgi:ferredoxin
MLSCLSVREHPGKSAGMSATKILKVRVDRERCQGHARCFALAPELFELDQFGNGRERGDGTVPDSARGQGAARAGELPGDGGRNY